MELTEGREVGLDRYDALRITCGRDGVMDDEPCVGDNKQRGKVEGPAVAFVSVICV